MNLTDDYDLTQVSPNSEPGFHLFHSKEHAAWYFHCNDVQGEPILFSQAYQQQSSAEKGLASVLKSAPKRTTQVAVDADQWQFVVKAGNHKEIGRSRLFPTEAACKAGIKYFQQVAKSQDPMAKTPPQPAAPKPAATTPTTVATPDPEMRHSFRLYFYEDDQQLLSGRIEVANSRQQQSFTGIDLVTIGNFLLQHLPRTGAEIVNSPGQLQETTLAGQLHHRMASDQLVNFRMIDQQEKLELLLNSPKLEADSTLISLELQAQHGISQQSHQVTIQHIQPDNHQHDLHFSADPATLHEGGMYVLTAKAVLRTDSLLQTVEGSTLLQMV